jgi:putative flavoprotein involved in K+ transport
MDVQLGAENRDVVIVGGGQAGLAVSWYLQLFGIDHVVIERGDAGESWRSARWDSFTLVTPAWMTRLPGLVQPRGVGESFTARDEFVALLEAYARSLPVRTGVAVTSVRLGTVGYRLSTSAGAVNARAVVAASGDQRVPVVPPMAERLPRPVLQLHAGEYRNPGVLPQGGVLVVGSGQSGGQIADELARAGRHVFLATSRVGRAPRRYRGRDTHDWVQEMGLDDQRVDRVRLEEVKAAHPLLSGAHGGQTLALQQLAREGVGLLGRLVDVTGPVLVFGDDLAENLRFGDEAAAAFRRSVDDHIDGYGIDAASPDCDHAERPNHQLGPSPRHLDMIAAGIRTVIWCVGFGPDTEWIDLPVLNDRGHVVSKAGVTAIPGFYTLGAPWLTHRGSGILYGVGTDASRIARHLVAFLHCKSPAVLGRADATPVDVALIS